MTLAAVTPNPLPVTSGGTGSQTQFTTGSVIIVGAAGVYTQDNANLFWDAVSKRLGIGTTTPGRALEIKDGTNPHMRLRFDSSNFADIKCDSTGFCRILPSQGRVYIDCSSSGANSAYLAFVGNTTQPNFLAAQVTDTGTNPCFAINVSTTIGAAISTRPLFSVTGGTGNGALLIDAKNRSGFGGNNTPTGIIHPVAGTATAGTAPLKFSVGTNLTSAENGAMEYDGTSLYFSAASTRHPISHPTIVLGSATGIDAKSVANTLALTNSSGKTLVLTSAVVRVTAASSITIGPTLSIGTTAGGTDLFASTALTGLTTTTTTYVFQMSGASILVANSGTIYVNLSVAATGTSMTIAVDLVGYYA